MWRSHQCSHCLCYNVLSFVLSTMSKRMDSLSWSMYPHFCDLWPIFESTMWTWVLLVLNMYILLNYYWMKKKIIHILKCCFSFEFDVALIVIWNYWKFNLCIMTFGRCGFNSSKNHSTLIVTIVLHHKHIYSFTTLHWF